MITEQTNQYQIEQAKASVAEFQTEVQRVARVIDYFQRVALKRPPVRSTKSNIAPMRRRSA